MKRNFAFIVVLFFVACQPEKKFDSYDHSMKIMDAMAAQEEAWNRGDIAAFMSVYDRSDSLLFIGSAGPKYGYETVLNNYRKAYPDASAMGKLKFKVLHLNFMGSEHAHMVGEWQLDRDSNDVSGYFSLVWQLKQEGWKIVRDHSS